MRYSATKHETVRSKIYKRVFMERSGWSEYSRSLVNSGFTWCGRLTHKGTTVFFGGHATERAAAIAIDKYILEKQLDYKKLQVLKPKS